MNSQQHEQWAFPERRNPSRSSPDYLGSKGLSHAVQNAIIRELGEAKEDLCILDVGCGKKPFYPYLKAYAKEYVGTEIFDSDLVDVVCPAENLAINDEWSDVTLCFSVLEHVDDPTRAVEELYRVTKGEGVVFASTHGCFPWHPYPQDHWRWTQTGLPLLFRRCGFSNVEIYATRGTVSGIFFLLAHYSFTWLQRGRFRQIVQKPAVASLNWLGELLDRRMCGYADINRHVTAIPEFFVVARK
jgi:SAM-dependent methyltransferase